MTLKDLLDLFEQNKGCDIEIELDNHSNNYNNYIYNNYIQVYATGTKGNFIIDRFPCLNILFHKEKVEATPCMDYGIFVPNSSQWFALDDDIMKLKNLIDENFLIALANFVKKERKNNVNGF